MGKVKDILNRFDKRSIVVLKNAFYSFFIKAIGVSVNFLTIPLVLSFLSPTQYGIWLTLTAILSWFSLFDLGFGNGLRNHLTTAISKNEMIEGRIFVSTTYVTLSIIFGSLIILFAIMHSFVNWQVIFNAPTNMSKDINLAVLFAMSFLFVQFVLRLITTVLLSFQKSAVTELIATVIQSVILLILYTFKRLKITSIASIAFAYSLTPVIIFFIFSLYFFLIKYPDLRPSFKFFKKSYVKKLLRLGLNFFVIQVAALVLYASDNFIITQLFSPASVTTYNVAFKYFSIAAIIFNIILAPFWSMVTHAFAQLDYNWIKKSVKRLLWLWVIIIIFSILQLIISQPIYKFWTNSKVSVPMGLSIVICIYSISTTYGSIFSNFINGVGKVKIQLILSIFGMIINIPMAIFFSKTLNLGVMGVPLATSITIIIANIFITLQYNKLINGTAKGIWYR